METRKNGRDEEYAPVAAALAPVLCGLPGKIITIDGRPGVGKTTLGRFVAWWFNVSLIELDLFLIEGHGRFQFRIYDIARIIEMRLRRNRPVVIEGVTVLRQLAAINRVSDFRVYVTNENAPTSRQEYELQLTAYEAEFLPRERAELALALNH